MHLPAFIIPNACAKKKARARERERERKKDGRKVERPKRRGRALCRPEVVAAEILQAGWCVQETEEEKEKE